MKKTMMIFLLTMMSLSLSATVVLNQVNEFGSNPGNLKMYYYAPTKLVGKAPIVVLLHGCAQAATDFDDETGWTALAEKNGFYLLLPQQQETNNSSRCFNWFESQDIQRGKGEAASIVQMIDNMESVFSIDSKRVFVTGLSAGAAMSSTMMATYPERFAAGALVAGIPYGCATSLLTAWPCMFATTWPAQTKESLTKNVLEASANFKGTYPKVMVVHGTGDQFVNFKNANFNLLQWLGVHNTDIKAGKEVIIEKQKVSLYKKGNKTVAALLKIDNMGHGFPVDSKSSCGVSGKYVLDNGVCGAKIISNFFGILK